MEKIRKHSKKRDAIYQAICSTKEHPNAEWVYEQVKPAYPDISLGTVYRNIAMFKEEGDIICVGSVNGQERYDADTSSHAHFVCRKCGAVCDLHEVGAPESPQVDGVVEGYQLSFYGVCGKCSGKQTH